MQSLVLLVSTGLCLVGVACGSSTGDTPSPEEDASQASDGAAPRTDANTPDPGTDADTPDPETDAGAHAAVAHYAIRVTVAGLAGGTGLEVAASSSRTGARS